MILIICGITVVSLFPLYLFDLTDTLQISFFPFVSLTVTFVLPSFFPVTFPLFVTVAICLLAELQLLIFPPSTLIAEVNPFVTNSFVFFNTGFGEILLNRKYAWYFPRKCWKYWICKQSLGQNHFYK